MKIPSMRISQRFVALKRNKNPETQERAQHLPLSRKEEMQTLREVKNKKRSLSENEKKKRNQIHGKESEEGSDSYGTPNIDLDYPTSEKNGGENKTMGKLPRLKKNC